MEENILEEFLEKLLFNWRKYMGCISGFVIGITIIKFGLINALFILVLAIVGYKLGDRAFTKNIKKCIIKKLKED